MKKVEEERRAIFGVDARTSDSRLLIRKIQVEASENHCDLCPHVWVSLAKKPPQECPGCGSREWNGKKIKGRTQLAIVLPKPLKVRNQDER